jgi:hypothetical protein
LLDDQLELWAVQGRLMSANNMCLADCKFGHYEECENGCGE